MNRIRTLLFLIPVIIFVNCSSKENEYAGVLKDMLQSKVEVPLDSMIGFCKDSIMKTNYTYVVYADSFECSMCTLKKQLYWDALKDSAKLRNNSMNVIFIFEPKKSDLDRFKFNVKATDLRFPVFIDSSSVFRRRNSMIKDVVATHSFLINSQNEIVLVGNPYENKEIERLLLQKMEK